MPERLDDSITQLQAGFAAFERLTILGRGPSAIDARGRSLPADSVVVTGPTYAHRDVFSGEPVGVLIGTPPTVVDKIARRYHATPLERRPVMMYTFLPEVPGVDFASHDLHPIPIGPTLVAAKLYDFDGLPYPTSGVFLMLLTAALGKGADVAGIDLYRHQSGKVYVTDPQPQHTQPQKFAWPAHHDLDCDLRHIRRAMAHVPGKWNLSAELFAQIQNPDLRG